MLVNICISAIQFKFDLQTEYRIIFFEIGFNDRVLKTKGLRVVDASIIPEIPNSNLNAAVYMIADKASEIILYYWKGRSSF